MNNRSILFGISSRCDKIIESGIIDISNVELLFDNDPKKKGKEMYGLFIQTVYYVEGAEVIVTTSEKFHIDIVRQLLKLGYRNIVLVQNHEENGYKLKKLNFEGFNFEKRDKKNILLYLQHRSYSGIAAIEYMMKNKLVNTEKFDIEYFSDAKKDEQYYYNLAKADFFITERGLPIYSEQIKKIQLWHGFPLKCMGAMDVGIDADRREQLRKNWDKYDYIISYGLNYTTFICACFGTIYTRFLTLGMPRNDLLYCTDGRKNIEDKFPASKGKKIIFYMPTFREISGRVNGNNEGYIFYWSNFDNNIFDKFCRKNNLYFIFKLHPSDSSSVRKWCCESENIGLLTDELLGEQSTYEFLNGTDALLTDYSSVYFDYLLLDKPIIFTNRDEEDYIKNRGVILEPLDFWRPGPVVNTMEDLEKELLNISNNVDGYKEKRKELLPFVHKYTDGNATQRLFDFMREI